MANNFWALPVTKLIENNFNCSGFSSTVFWRAGAPPPNTSYLSTPFRFFEDAEVDRKENSNLSGLLKNLYF